MGRGRKKLNVFTLLLMLCVLYVNGNTVHAAGVTWEFKDGCLTIEGDGDWSGTTPEWASINNTHKSEIVRAEVKVKDITSTANMFIGLENLQEVNFEGSDFSKVTKMTSMFSGCSSLQTVDLSKLGEAENVTDMTSMFYNCSSLKELDLSMLKTGNVTNMKSMFSGCSGLTTLNLTGFNTEKVTSMLSMFQNCSSLTTLNLGSFNTGNVTTIQTMFSGCSGLTQLDLSSFNLSGITFATGVSSAFANCSGLTSITSPQNVKVAISLPSVIGYIWKDVAGNTVTSISTGSASATYTRASAEQNDNGGGNNDQNNSGNNDNNNGDNNGQNNTSSDKDNDSDKSSEDESQLPVAGTKKEISSGEYKITKSAADSKEVSLIKLTNSKKTSFTIPATVKIDGYTYTVTEIAPKAFKGNKQLKSVTIGKNVKKIGKEAFSDCKSLNKIVIKSTVLKSVGKNAIKGISGKATIKVPKKQLTQYKKLFKSKTGFKKSMKIKK